MEGIGFARSWSDVFVATKLLQPKVIFSIKKCVYVTLLVSCLIKSSRSCTFNMSTGCTGTTMNSRRP